MNSVITIVDYGVGNLLSVARSFEACGGKVLVTSKPSDVEKAQKLVLPGVGAFGDAMEALKKRGLIQVVQDFANKDLPFLGICLGMQLMFEVSEEFGNNEGLKLIPGKVKAIPPLGTNSNRHKIPHIGWNHLLKPDPIITPWAGNLLSGVDTHESVYFVHSYAAYPTSDEHLLAYTNYHGLKITAMVKKGNVFGCQFHPEKSGKTGLKIIQNFLNLTPSQKTYPRFEVIS